MNRIQLTQFVKQKASDIGFSFCGIAQAEQLQEEARALEQWLQQGRHGKMHYMENYFDKRIDPRQLMHGAKTVISLMYNYYTPKKQHDFAAPKISKYAYGEDYHNVIKDKLKAFVEIINEHAGDIEARIFVDSAPVLDKAWAKKSGIGWQAKNTNIIHPKAGSFFFLAEIICDLKLEYDGPMKDYCGTCTACIEACPTDALHDPYFIDASKCISYLTIELRDELLPDEFRKKTENWMFGCDICQDVCPWNRFAKQHAEPRFEPDEKLLNMSDNEWIELTEEIYKELFKDSAVQRTKFAGLKRNIRYLQ